MLENIKTLAHNIIFEFLDEANNKGFTNTTSWNFVVKTHKDNAQNPRWGKVISTGPTVPDHIAVGDYILIEPLMWTHGFLIDGKKYWSTNLSKVIGSLKEEPTGIF